MPVLTRADIVKKNKRYPVKKVNTDGWKKDTFVYVRTLRASEMSEVSRIADSKGGEMDLLIDWCILGVCDKSGKRMFKPEDKQSLLNGPLIPVRDCVEAFMDFNGITEGDAEKN